MTTVEFLRAARALIESPETWTQLRLYANGRYCAVGALMAVPGLQSRCEADMALQGVLAGMGEEPALSLFNDRHSHGEVLALFDRAIAYEEAKAQEFIVTPEREAISV